MLNGGAHLGLAILPKNGLYVACRGEHRRTTNCKLLPLLLQAAVSRQNGGPGTGCGFAGTDRRRGASVPSSEFSTKRRSRSAKQSRVPRSRNFRQKSKDFLGEEWIPSRPSAGSLCLVAVQRLEAPLLFCAPPGE